MSTRTRTPSLYSQDKELPYGPNETEYQDVATNHSKDGVLHQTVPSTRDDADEESVFEEYYDTKRPMPVRFYRRKRFWVFCVIGTIIFLAIFIPILIIYIIPAIAQAMMNSANMHVVQMNMTQPTDSDMHVSVHASVVGIPKIFSASLEFQEQVVVSWNNRLIGSMNLAPVHVKKGNGNFQQETTFYINDTAAFGDFAKILVMCTLAYGAHHIACLFCFSFTHEVWKAVVQSLLSWCNVNLKGKRTRDDKETEKEAYALVQYTLIVVLCEANGPS